METIKKIKIRNIKVIQNEDVYDITVIKNSNFFANGTLVHNCGEVVLSSHDSCRLGSIVLSSLVKNAYAKDAYVDYDLLSKVSRASQRFMDDIIDLEEVRIMEIINKIKSDPERDEIKRVELNLWEKVLEVAKKGRRTGLGVIGLGDMLAKLGLTYASEESLKVVNKVFEQIAYNSYAESVQLAKERGSFPIWNLEKEQQNPFIIRVISNHFSTKEYNDYCTYGRRNIANLSIAPTGTISLLCNTTSGIEPVFKCYYKRRRKINPNEPNVKVDFVDEVGDSWQEYPVFHPEMMNWMKTLENFKNNTIEEIQNTLSNYTTEELDELVKQSPWFNSESHSINYTAKVIMQGLIQKWIDHSISITHNLPKNISLDEVNNIYIQAWKNGCKGCTVYREGSRSGVLITEDNKDENNNDGFVELNAPKRPKELKADYYIATSNGVKYAVIIGLWENGKPYEIFAFENPPVSKNTKGKIIKVRKGEYKFINGEFEIENIQLAADRVEQRAHTILLSMLLRHRAPITHVVNVAKKIDENITSFSSVCRRILSKYIPNEETQEKCPECGDTLGGKLIREESCLHCDTCSYSRC